MRLYRNALLGGVAALALGGFTVGTTSTADAFDNVNWTWNQDIDEDITKLININVNINPVGMVDDQIMQIQIGDVKADSHLSGVYNWKPRSEQVVHVEGYTRSKKLSIEAGLEYGISGSGDTTGYRNTDSSSLNRVVNKNSFKKELDGSLVVSSESDNEAIFVGGAGAAAGYFSLNPPAGNIVGAGVIGVIGAGAIEEGDAAFDAELSGAVTRTRETSTLNRTRNSWSNGYTYDYSGSGEGRFRLDIQSEDITRYYGLYPTLQDATKELPKVESVAAAIGNTISIETDTIVQEHSLQVVADTNCEPYRGRAPRVEGGAKGSCATDFDDADFDLAADFDVNDKFIEVDSGNYNHDVGLLMALSAGAGLLGKADITATSTVNDILNASVESTATAIGNLKSITVDTNRFDNGLVIADITQVSVADVSAYSTVGGGDKIFCQSSFDGCGTYGGIDIVNYNKLGGMTIATSTATAIGNAVNISVNSGQSVPTPTP